MYINCLRGELQNVVSQLRIIRKNDINIINKDNKI